MNDQIKIHPILLNSKLLNKSSITLSDIGEVIGATYMLTTGLTKQIVPVITKGLSDFSNELSHLVKNNLTEDENTTLLGEKISNFYTSSNNIFKEYKKHFDSKSNHSDIVSNFLITSESSKYVDEFFYLKFDRVTDHDLSNKNINFVLDKDINTIKNTLKKLEDILKDGANLPKILEINNFSLESINKDIYANLRYYNDHNKVIKSYDPIVKIINITNRNNMACSNYCNHFLRFIKEAVNLLKVLIKKYD